MTLQEMQVSLDALRATRASGVRTVTLEGMTVEYKSDADLARAIADLEVRVAAEQAKGAGVRPMRRILIETGRGL